MFTQTHVDVETDENNDQDLGNSAPFIPHTIADLIEIRADILDSWKCVDESISRMNSAFSRIKGNGFYMDSSGNRYSEPSEGRGYHTKERIETLDFALYRYALDKLNITKAMTQIAKEKFLEKVKESKIPFSREHLQDLALNIETIFRQSSHNTIVDVYRHLIGIPYNGGNWGSGKKDNLQKVEKVFRANCTDVQIRIGFRGECTIEQRYSSCPRLPFDDLLTACRLIEGKGFSDYSNNMHAILNAAPKGTEAETEYFHLQAFKNGNVKVRWREDKLNVLDKLNAIGSGSESYLPDTMRKRYKAEHFHNGGEVDARVLFGNCEGIEPDPDKDFNFFETPETVVEMMITLADYKVSDTLITLDPSAGYGRICNAVPFKHGCTAVEFNHHRAKHLDDRTQWNVYEADFLKWRSPFQFDRVLMNPPFNNRTEAFHLIKAFSHLTLGGILVCVLPDGWFFRDDLKARTMRKFLVQHQHKESICLPIHTFENTQVKTRLVTLKKLD